VPVESPWHLRWAAVGAIFTVIGVIVAVVFALAPRGSGNDGAGSRSADRADSPSASSAASASPPPDRPSLVGRYQDVEFSSTYGLALDTDPPKVVDFSAADVYLDIMPLSLLSRFPMALLPPRPAATYAGCRGDTRYVDRIETDDLQSGSQICLTVQHGQMVLLTVRHLPSDQDSTAYIAVDVTVWQGTG
jgi:hypothetical protein